MSDIIKNYQQQVEPENPGKSKAFKTAVSICTAMVLIAGIMLAVKGIGTPERHSVMDVPEAAETAVPIDEVNILGNYMVRLVSGLDTARMTGYIEADALGRIALHVLSAYEPKVYDITINDDGTISNPELGQGKMSFKKISDKTTINFSNGHTTCTLVK